jgi:hypothetical protein
MKINDTDVCNKFKRGKNIVNDEKKADDLRDAIAKRAQQARKDAYADKCPKGGKHKWQYVFMCDQCEKCGQVIFD